MKKIYGYAFAAALMTLASCSSDDAPEVNKPTPEGEVAGYVVLNLPTGTRAGGTTVKFYQGGVNGTEVACTAVTGHEGVYQLDKVPDYVVAYDASLSLAANATTDDPNAQAPAVYVDGKYGSQITKANIFHDLSKSAEATPVTIYVEQVSAKGTVVLAKDEALTNDMSGVNLTGYTIAFTPEYVFINGVALKTPVIKPVATTGKTNGNYDWSATGYSDANGKGTHWTSTYYAWNTNDVKHYPISGDGAAAKSTEQKNVLFFERAKGDASEVKKEHTHIVVAGKYTLTSTDPTKYPLPGEDGTFWIYGSTQGVPNVYVTEAAVKKAMNVAADATFEEVKKTNDPKAMTTALKIGNETCIKFDHGYGYYAAPIETTIGTNKIGTGVVRNHAYSITVNQIKGLGTAIVKIDEPIVPEEPEQNQDTYLKLQIEVNKMVDVAGQTVGWGN